MCGLAGLLLYPTQRSETEWAELRELFTRMLVFNEERGQEASGVALIRRDGIFRLFKQPVPPSQLVKMEPYQAIMAALGPETTCLLGHTREPTKGSRWNNDNNHPLLVGHTVGIHNGMIDNDDDIFTHSGLPRAGEVDSEVIFSLLDRIGPISNNGSYPSLVQRQISLLEGFFATLSVDLRWPTRLLVLKYLRPLCLHYEKRLNALFFSSRYLFLRKAFGHTVITEAMESKQGFIFDAEQLLKKGNTPLCCFDIASAN
jgi:glucosamine 6-phosphate synthetase-like amidotransferase/phosphosugar isomerase protein